MDETEGRTSSRGRKTNIAESLEEKDRVQET
jgi:hypothetical protein